MSDNQDVPRNDLALRIATDVLGDPSRADGLAEYFAKENSDVHHALERFAESRCATLRADLARAREPDLCSVCVGQPFRDGRPCVCGGRGTALAETQGLRETCYDLRQQVEALTADLARVTEEASEHRSIVASLWDYLRSRDAVPPREGSDHDRIMVGLGTLELRATAALAAERERCAGIADSYEEREDVDTPTAIGAAIRAQPTPTTEARDV